jgi:hypothetical protein
MRWRDAHRLRLLEAAPGVDEVAVAGPEVLLIHREVMAVRDPELGFDGVAHVRVQRPEPLRRTEMSHGFTRRRGR